MSEKEILLKFNKALKSNSPQTKEQARKYLTDLGIINKKGQLSKNYQN